MLSIRTLVVLAFFAATHFTTCAGLSNSDATCGKRPAARVTGRIVGGASTYFGEVPWQALIKESSFFGLLTYRKCGGVLVHQRWVITAAHCRAGLFGTLQVILGEYNINSYIRQPNQTIEPRSVAKVIVHPYFNSLSLANDLALIRLKEPVELTPNIQPICLPSVMYDIEYNYAFVSGWGYTDFATATLPNVLQIVQLPVLTNFDCQSMYKTAGYQKTIGSKLVCAGYKEGGRDSCEGDSGGPLMSYNENYDRWVLVGIVSNGVRCAEPNLPGIYTRISSYTKWIYDTIRHEEYYN